MATSIALNADNMVLMSKYKDKTFDIAIIDPPTGQGEDKNHLSRRAPVPQKNGNSLKIKTRHVTSTWDAMPPNQAFFDELFRVSKRQIIMCENWLTFEQKSNSPGRIVWNLLRENDFSACNIMWASFIKRIDYFEYLWDGMRQGIAINERRQLGNKQLNQKRIHPSEKPFKVYAHLLKTYVKPGWSILDTHMGSGALRIVADKMGYDFFGCEQDAEIFTLQEQRWNQYKFNIFEHENTYI